MIKHPDKDTTLPEPLSSGDFVKRLEEALQEEKSTNSKLNLDRFREVVFATAKDDADWQSWEYRDAWVSAVWVRGQKSKDTRPHTFGELNEQIWNDEGGDPVRFEEGPTLATSSRAALEIRAAQGDVHAGEDVGLDEKEET